jgi:glycosyltransferase involved in cell wall biosynthesis
MLRDALASLMALDTGGQFTYEVLVVDNASTDETAGVVEEAARRSPVPMRRVYEPRAGVACARNCGIAETRTTWIAFFDDDQVADPMWLKELLVMAREKQVRCVGGANRLLLPEGGPHTLSRACRSLLSESVGRDTACPYSRTWAPGTGNMLINRNVFAEVGSFDETLREAGEDADLYGRMWKAKIAAWYTPAAISHHVVPEYRLKSDYLRWKSMRNGGHAARRHLEDWRRATFCVMLLARVARALLVHLPRLLWARLLKDDELAQNSQCLLWRAQGYVRFTLHLVAPRLFAQRRFFDWLDFRSEQQMFAP